MSAAVEGSFPENMLDHLLRCPRDSLSGDGKGSSLILLSDLGGGGVSVAMVAVEGSFFPGNIVDNDALLLCCLGDSPSGGGEGGLSSSSTFVVGGGALLLLGLPSLLSQPI